MADFTCKTKAFTKLDVLGPIDNRTSTNFLYHFVEKENKKGGRDSPRRSIWAIGKNDRMMIHDDSLLHGGLSGVITLVTQLRGN